CSSGDSRLVHPCERGGPANGLLAALLAPHEIAGVVLRGGDHLPADLGSRREAPPDPADDLPASEVPLHTIAALERLSHADASSVAVTEASTPRYVIAPRPERRSKAGQVKVMRLTLVALALQAA